ncbi:MAG: hypothetical protein C0596_18410 [Marinilabiliales bacterium]|nr:MAG: hypothetical protein C0596_18410 [Marinilabiliales bacterium]
MKKLKLLFLTASVGMFLASCTIYHQVDVTNNPVGTKVGVAKGSNFGNCDVTLETAAKNGGITKIGTVEYKAKGFLIFMKYTTTVTGE